MFNTYYKCEFELSEFEEFSEEELFLNPSSCLFSTNFEKLDDDLKKLNLNKTDIFIISLVDLIDLLSKIRKT